MLTNRPNWAYSFLATACIAAILPFVQHFAVRRSFGVASALLNDGWFLRYSRDQLIGHSTHLLPFSDPLLRTRISCRSVRFSSLKAMSPQKRRQANTETTADDISDQDTSERKPTRGRSRLKGGDEESTQVSKPKSPAKKSPKKQAIKRKEAPSSPRKKDSEGKSSPKKTKKAPAHQVLTERDPLPKLWTEEMSKKNGSYTFKIATWNVAGLRALMKNRPDDLSALCRKHNLDVLCLQETKLQEQHLDDPKLAIRGHLLQDEGYDAFFSCSTAKKGYSGTAFFVRRRGKSGKKQQKTLGSFFAKDNSTSGSAEASQELPFESSDLTPTSTSYELDVPKHNQEGRVIAVDFPLFTLINVYVPNSGQKLERLDYRTSEWDKDLLAFAQKKQSERGRPVMWLGDLNVAHTNLEVWNDGAKHLPKQAGVTPQERLSFQDQLDSGFIDAFRHLHGAAKGHYSYWSQRAGNRAPNKGLRLDYFICDPSFFNEENRVLVRDSYMDTEQLGSDHCPAILELEIKSAK